VINIVLAEVFGTFILTVVALSAIQTQDLVGLFVGLTLAVVVMAIGTISGSHINPAVTFGLWATRKLKTVMVPFYWGAQFIGAAAALVVMNLVSQTQHGISFAHIGQFDGTLFGIELVGTAVFLFGLVSVLNRKELTDGAKALGIGLSLLVGVAVASSVNAQARSTAIANYQKAASSVTEDNKEEPTIPAVLFSKGATLNPAISFVQTEMTESELKGTSDGGETEQHISRFALDSILGTLIGAALGANLALLVNYRFRG
jgi:glycerol uptake facilitator-like aquaporin